MRHSSFAGLHLNCMLSTHTHQFVSALNVTQNTCVTVRLAHRAHSGLLLSSVCRVSRRSKRRTLDEPRAFKCDYQGNAKGKGELQMVGIGCGAECQVLLGLRHNMTDAIKVPGDSGSGGEERMGVECIWRRGNHPTAEQLVKPHTISQQGYFSVIMLWYTFSPRYGKT